MIRILYVEDNDDNVYMMTNRLKRRGYEVIVAEDGARGLEMAKSESPALILMDLSLPVMDGWEATRRLKQATETAHIPVIALSSHAMAGDREAALDAGCDDVFAKPIDRAALVALLGALVVA